MKIRIYQINMGKDEKRVAYQGLDELERFQGSKEIDSNVLAVRVADYCSVFSVELIKRVLTEVLPLL